MSRKVTLHLRDDLIARANEIAIDSERELEDVLADWIDRYTDDLPVETLSDNEVLRLCSYEMNFVQTHELQELLCRHREHTLDNGESARLDELLQIYRRAIIRKARAIQVAAARGLLTDCYGEYSGIYCDR